MASSIVFLSSFLFTLTTAQTLSTVPEVHPTLQTWECTLAGGCVSKISQIVLDQLAHPLYQKDNPTLDCGVFGNGPNSTVCPDEKTCAQNCIVDGIPDYSKFGVRTNGSSLLMNQIEGEKNVSPRVYLLDEAGENYEMLSLTGREFAFNVDVTKLPCGSGWWKSEINTAGAAIGSGYCDAQCYTLPFINGEANIPAHGSCCNEMDIWEANSRANSIAPHTCSKPGLYRCTGPECEFDGVCDEWGCSYNPYALGNKEYYGLKFTVDTTRPFTVVTQFPADASGTLTAIRRLYIQDGKVINNAAVNINGIAPFDELNTEYCSRPGGGTFIPLGGMPVMGEALSRGMVLAFSIWWDIGGFMNWLNSGDVGPCNATEGNPEVIVQIEPNPAVVFNEVKWGEIGSTFSA
ncbi:hypothetical protein HYALB_00008497 [Hymenoscyphus albidus]|uniref:Glucanase n=1 Tax=Hymenoscyphus albidus TaxID=595503 RepID=A0A9N9Q8V5_9HELO|nr:hypothetical protein HYALB_00008497 [Hymenoscyphus albidus]